MKYLLEKVRGVIDGNQVHFAVLKLRLHILKFNDFFLQLASLLNNSVVKVGVALHKDLQSLFKVFILLSVLQQLGTLDLIFDLFLVIGGQVVVEHVEVHLYEVPEGLFFDSYHHFSHFFLFFSKVILGWLGYVVNGESLLKYFSVSVRMSVTFELLFHL